MAMLYQIALFTDSSPPRGLICFRFLHRWCLLLNLCTSQCNFLKILICYALQAFLRIAWHVLNAWR